MDRPQTDLMAAQEQESLHIDNTAKNFFWLESMSIYLPMLMNMRLTTMSVLIAVIESSTKMAEFVILNASNVTNALKLLA